MAYTAYVQRLIGRLYPLWYFYIPTCRFTAQPYFLMDIPCLLWKRGRAVPCPVALLAFAPALSGLVGPPGAAVLVVLRHLDAVLAAPALRVLGALRGWLRWRLHLEPL